jgi:trk system potassium uptake protein TrkA
LADRISRADRSRAERVRRGIAHDAPVLVIGLGRFGAATAGQLDRLDREVLAIDGDERLVQKWADRVTHAVQADARNIDALRQIGASEFAIAVVAVGSSIEASVLITANLVDLGVPQIWAKAISQSHGKILSRIGANHVIYPEAEAGERVAHLVSGRMIDFIEFDDDFALVKMYPPKVIRGVPLAKSLVRSKYGVTVVGVKSPGLEFTYATNETILEDDDVVIVSGNSGDIERFASLN